MANSERKELYNWLCEREWVQRIDFTRDGYKHLIIELSFSSSNRDLIELCNRTYGAGFTPKPADTPGFVTLTYTGNAGAD